MLLLLGFITALPYIVAHLTSIRLNGMGGWMFLIAVLALTTCGITTIILAMRMNSTERFNRMNLWLFAVALGGLASLFPIAAMVMNMSNLYPNPFDSLGIGMYVMPIGFLIAIIGGIYARVVWSRYPR